MSETPSWLQDEPVLDVAESIAKNPAAQKAAKQVASNPAVQKAVINAATNQAAASWADETHNRGSGGGDYTNADDVEAQLDANGKRINPYAALVAATPKEQIDAMKTFHGMVCVCIFLLLSLYIFLYISLHSNTNLLYLYSCSPPTTHTLTLTCSFVLSTSSVLASWPLLQFVLSKLRPVQACCSSLSISSYSPYSFVVSKHNILHLLQNFLLSTLVSCTVLLVDGCSYSSLDLCVTL